MVRYSTADGGTSLFGGVYLRPGERKGEATEKLESLNDCDIIADDLNTRHPEWGAKSGDNHKNTYGYAVYDYAKDHGYQIDAPETPTFRDISVIDICMKKSGEKSTWTDKVALEHQGIIMRLNMSVPIRHTGRLSLPLVNKDL